MMMVVVREEKEESLAMTNSLPLLFRCSWLFKEEKKKLSDLSLASSPFIVSKFSFQALSYLQLDAIFNIPQFGGFAGVVVWKNTQHDEAS